MSNLDVFQSPQQLEQFADLVLDDFGDRPAFEFRGLSTFHSFLKVVQENPDLLNKMVRIGFENVGYGLDGYGRKVWTAIKKGMNNEDACLSSIKLCRELGIQAEILMVTGHTEVDTEETLNDAYDFLRYLVEQYGVIPSPYVASPCIPGSIGWQEAKYGDIVDTLMEKPWTFQALEFAALASTMKGHDADSASVVNRIFMKMCRLPGSTTQAILPITPNQGPVIRRLVRATNFGRFERQ